MWERVSDVIIGPGVFWDITMSHVLQSVYAILMIGSCLIQVGLVIYAWRRRSTPGAVTFMWLVVSTAFTELCYFGLASAPNPTIGYIWARLRFLGVALLAVHFLLFALDYVGRHDWFRSRRYLWLYAIPILTQLIIWTKPFHQRFYISWQLESKGLLSAEIARFSVWYWIHGLYSYLLVGLGYVILVQNLGRAKGMYRRQVWLIVIGSAVTIIASLPGGLALMKPPFNTFPLGSTIATVYFAWALFRYGLLDLVPVAHDTIFRSLSEMAIVLDTRNRIVDMNPAALWLVGMVEAQVIGQPAAAVFGTWPTLASKLQDQEIADADLVIEVDGAKKNLALRPSPLYDRRGELTGRIFIVRDITERKQTEDSLAERSRVLQMLHAIATEIGTELDLDTLLHHIVARATDLLDADRGGGVYVYDETLDALRLSAASGINRDRMGILIQPGEGVTGRVFQSLQPLIVNDYTTWEGHTVVLAPSPPSAVMGIPLLAQGQMLGVLTVIANSARRTYSEHDMQFGLMLAAQAAAAIQTARLYEQARQEIDERKRAENALRTSDAMMRALVNAQTETVFLTETDGTILTVNDTAARRFGKRPDELIGLNAFDLMPPDLAASRKAQGDLVTQSGQPVQFEDERAGSWYESTIYPVFDTHGTVTQFAIVARDITERRHAEQQQVALAIEREKVNVLAQFITMTAHEFRTPLSTINMNLALLRRDADPQTRSDRVEIVNQQIAYITNLIETMLKMTRLDSQTTLTLAPIDLNQLLRDLETRFSPLAETHALALVIDCDPHLPRVPANAPVLYDALYCLVDNALRHTDEGGTITCRSHATADGVVLEIADTGKGISPDDLPHIFDRFFRADQARSTRGAGLGLSIARKAVDLHGGTIEVDSVLGQGSTFRIWLPHDETS
jgi:PAS domain S-box-containing protein